MGRQLLTTLIVSLFTFTSAQAESGHGDTGSFEEPTEGFSSESVNTPTYEDFEAIDQGVLDLFQAYEYRARAKEQKLTAPERQELLDGAMEETEESVRPTVQTKVIIDFGQPKTEKKSLQAERREVEQKLSAAGLFPGNAPVPAAAKPSAVTPASVTAPNIVLNNAVNVAAAPLAAPVVTPEEKKIEERKVSATQSKIVIVDGRRMIFSEGKFYPLPVRGNSDPTVTKRLKDFLRNLLGAQRTTASARRDYRQDAPLEERSDLVNPGMLTEIPVTQQLSNANLDIPVFWIFVGGMATTMGLILTWRLRKQVTPVLTWAMNLRRSRRQETTVKVTKKSRPKGPIRIPEERTLDGTFLFPRK